ncbi:galactarate dehydratase [bacterium]|nr:galactarate dehydratase [bacterium]
MTHNTPRLIRMRPEDNVAIVAEEAGQAAGTVLPGGLALRERVPQAHKVALVDLAPGDAVIRYGVVIGHAAEPLPAGSWVNERRLTLPAAPGLTGLPMATRATALPPLEGHGFEGYRNPDGSVGTRNLLAITTTVQCVAGVVDHAVRRIRAELLPRFPHVDDVVALDHTYGCGVAIDVPEAEIPIRTLRNIARNPNFGGQALVVSLGCEKLQPARLALPEAATVVLQDPEHHGFTAMVAHIMAQAEALLAKLNARRRETCPVSDLVLGVQCGGSDALSGVTANPALGIASDLIVRAGGTVMFSEVTEVRDGVAELTARAVSPGVAQEIIDQLAWYDAYLACGQADRAANTTPGNKAGGLSNIVEKAMGSIVKSGSAPISGVVAPGDKAKTRGLLFAATPASDFICGTLQLAAGATVHVFTTGRGTPYGLAALPVIKVATRSDLARRWFDLIDIDAGPVATGGATLDEMGWQMFTEILAVASGKRTAAERLGLVNDLALFTPGPVT